MEWNHRDYLVSKFSTNYIQETWIDFSKEEFNCTMNRFLRLIGRLSRVTGRGSLAEIYESIDPLLFLPSIFDLHGSEWKPCRINRQTSFSRSLSLEFVNFIKNSKGFRRITRHTPEHVEVKQISSWLFVIVFIDLFHLFSCRSLHEEHGTIIDIEFDVPCCSLRMIV